MQRIPLFNEIWYNYHNCSQEKNNLSDTWEHTNSDKACQYTLQEMLEMRKNGNVVNSRIVDSTYLLDEQLVSDASSIVKELLENGEPEFGQPEKNIRVNGQHYSSLYLREVKNAETIIRWIQAMNISEPHIIEIGGGIGLLHYVLRSYYSDRLTYYAVDIPETLLIQEWYIRNCLPNTQTCHVPNGERFTSTSGSSHFINAYDIVAHSFTIHAAVNIDSMQEMTSETALSYIRFVERNITGKGIFYFQNHYGHSHTSYTEPSEYEFDPYWRIVDIQFSNQYETCSQSEQLRMILSREKKTFSIEDRRLFLRIVWNGFVTDSILKNGYYISELLKRLYSRNGYENFMCASKSINTPDACKLIESEINGLPQQLHLKYPDFFDSPEIRLNSHVLCNSGNIPIVHKIRFAQDKVCELMEKSKVYTDNDAAAIDLKDRFKTISDEFEGTLEEAGWSEYWAMYASCALLYLDAKGRASKLICDIVKYTNVVEWKIRAAYLLTKYKCHTEAEVALEKILSENLNEKQLLKVAGLLYANGANNVGEDILNSKMGKLLSDPSLLPLLLKIYIKSNEAEKLVDRLDDIEKLTFLSPVYLTFFSGMSNICQMDKVILHRIEDFILRNTNKESVDYKEKLTVNLIKWKLTGSKCYIEEATKVVPLIWDKYYCLGFAGKIFLESGLAELADNCFERSVYLRPGVFWHHDFIGQTFLSNACYERSLKHYRLACELKPYLRFLRIKKAYSALPDALHALGIFGMSDDLDIFVQRHQTFYDDI